MTKIITIATTDEQLEKIDKVSRNRSKFYRDSAQEKLEKMLTEGEE